MSTIGSTQQPSYKMEIKYMSRKRSLMGSFIYFNWKIITFQYGDSFCHISSWISHRYTCVPPSWTPLPPPSPPHPSGLLQSTIFGCPASCIDLALVIYFTYGNIHVSMLFSQILPPLPSPTESKSLFLTSVSPLLPWM